jgi:(2Fe-2S) ferredoxin
VYPEGVWYWAGTEADVTEIVEKHVVGGQIVARLLMPGHEPPKKQLKPLKP